MYPPGNGQSIDHNYKAQVNKVLIMLNKVDLSIFINKEKVESDTYEMSTDWGLGTLRIK